MPVTFYSKTTASIVMFNADAKKLLGIIGKKPTAKGIITVTQIPAAIQALLAATDNEPSQEETIEVGGDGYSEDEVFISLRQRAAPLIEMLRASESKSVDVTWESD